MKKAGPNYNINKVMTGTKGSSEEWVCILKKDGSFTFNYKRENPNQESLIHNSFQPPNRIKDK